MGEGKRIRNALDFVSASSLGFRHEIVPSDTLTGKMTVSIFVNMSATNIKEEAKRLLEKLPDNLTWDDLMHEIYVRQSIEAGLADSEAGKLVEVSEVRKQFGLS